MADQRLMTRDEVRAVDRRAIDEFGMSGLVLMENAGRGAADLLRARGAVGPVIVACGRGNNGGDGLVIARHLEAAQVPVEVLLFASPEEFTGDARTNLEILQAARSPITRAADLPVSEVHAKLSTADWIVDAVLGTGLSGEVREPYRGAIEQLNASGRPVLAVDLPSGMDCDTGQPLGVCVRALLTATFVAAKRGFVVEGADQWTGEVVALPIGVPRRLLSTYDSPTGHAGEAH